MSIPATVAPRPLHRDGAHRPPGLSLGRRVPGLPAGRAGAPAPGGDAAGRGRRRAALADLAENLDILMRYALGLDYHAPPGGSGVDRAA